MRRFFHSPGLLMSLLSLILLGGCFNAGTIGRLVTDQPQILPAVEAFNASQMEYKLRVVYSEAPARDTLDHIIHPDLVITPKLNSPEILSTFQDLSGMIEDETLHPEEFYPALLDLGRRGGELNAIPVSFQLPAFIYKKTDGEHRFYLTLEDLASDSPDFSTQTNQAYTKMSFSPLWNPRFLPAVIKNPGFLYDSESLYLWNTDELGLKTSSLKSFEETSKIPYGAQEQFRQKYLYEPSYKSLNDSRIQYAYMTSSDFFKIPFQKRKELDFSWFMIDGKVPVTDNILFAAIPGSASHPKAAQAFIEWMSKPETQRLLIETKAIHSPETFGIAGGFSALKEISDTLLPQVHKELVGRIPPEKILRMPNPGPLASEKIDNEVIIPWIQSALLSTEESLPDLRARINHWLLQNPNL